MKLRAILTLAALNIRAVIAVLDKGIVQDITASATGNNLKIQKPKLNKRNCAQAVAIHISISRERSAIPVVLGNAALRLRFMRHEG